LNLPGEDPYYNWLTQSRLDTFASVGGSFGSADVNAAQSALMFTVGRGPQRQNRPIQRPSVGPDFGRTRLGAGEKAGGEDDVDGSGEHRKIAVISLIG
jgi:DNA-PKcs, CC5